jgi:hypothetical protein
MSNSELRLKNKEMGIRITDETRITTNLSWLLPAYRRQVSRILILKNLGTLPAWRQTGTWYLVQ